MAAPENDQRIRTWHRPSTAKTSTSACPSAALTARTEETAGTPPSTGDVPAVRMGGPTSSAGLIRHTAESQPRPMGRPPTWPADLETATKPPAGRDGCPPTVSIRRPPISASPCTPRPQPSNGRASPASFQAGSSAPCPCLRRGARPAPVRWRLSRPPAFSCRRECSHAPAPV